MKIFKIIFAANLIFFLYLHPRKGEKFLKTSENSSVGRAQPCQGWGREFEPRFSLSKKAQTDGLFLFPVNPEWVARMVESVDTQDLKSCGFTAVRVQVPLRVRMNKKWT